MTVIGVAFLALLLGLLLGIVVGRSMRSERKLEAPEVRELKLRRVFTSNLQSLAANQGQTEPFALTVLDEINTHNRQIDRSISR